jgi:hypothetical protein
MAMQMPLLLRQTCSEHKDVAEIRHFYEITGRPSVVDTIVRKPRRGEKALETTGA